jgi:threonine-phosphate decarboxylase
MLHGGDIFRNQGIRLDFSVNTTPLGMPDAVRAALVSRIDDYGRYPDPLCQELREAFSRAENVPAERIVCGNGAADLIFRLCLAYRPKHTLICAPAFSEYGRAALLAGSRITRHVLRGEDGFMLTETFLDDFSGGVDLVMLCNPNNPTGKLLAPALLEKILAKCRAQNALLMIDECFLPFTGAAPFRDHFDDRCPGSLAILGALTKTYSLAGIRLGFLLADSAEFAAKIMDTGQAWSVSAPAQYAGLAALGIPEWIAEARKIIDAERPWLEAELRALGFTAVESAANFILFRTETPLLGPLKKRGILIRTCGSFPGLDNAWYRIGIKKHGDNAELVAALRNILQEEDNG